MNLLDEQYDPAKVHKVVNASEGVYVLDVLNLVIWLHSPRVHWPFVLNTDDIFGDELDTSDSGVNDKVPLTTGKRKVLTKKAPKEMGQTARGVGNVQRKLDQRT